MYSLAEFLAEKRTFYEKKGFSEEDVENAVEIWREYKEKLENISYELMKEKMFFRAADYESRQKGLWGRYSELLEKIEEKYKNNQEDK